MGDAIRLTAVAKRYIAGLVRLEERLVIILDINKLFAQGEIELDPSSASQISPTESGA